MSFLPEIFTNILQDVNLNFIIDALNECQIDLPKFLDFIIQESSISPHVEWIVSSRNWPEIEKRLELAEEKVNTCLELNIDQFPLLLANISSVKCSA
jgi:hypothetical protein